MNYAVIDLASLAWLLPELDSTLKVARTQLALAHNSQGAEFAKQMASAKRAVHDAVGALQVIEARGVVHYLETLEKTIAHCASLGGLDTHAHAVLDEACFSVVAYLSELHTTGVLLQPVVLFPDYEALCLLNPAKNDTHHYHPADLYFPGLTPRLPRQADEKQAALDNRGVNLHKVRNTYETLLLQVFKGTATQKELTNLSLLIGIIANDANQAHAYSFWKSCQAAVQTLQSDHGSIDLGLKRWLGRLNLQIQRLAAGSKPLSERLFREALFYIANASTQHASHLALHLAVTQTYQLAGSVPTDLKLRRYGNASPVNPSVLLGKLATFKLAWDEAAPAPTESEGLTLTDGMLLRRLRIAQQFAMDLQLSLSEHHLTVLVSVAKALAQAANAVSESGKPLHKSLGLEGAKAILWIEEALKQAGQPQVSQTQQADRLIARLDESKVSDNPLPLGADMSAQGTQALMGEVIREAIVTLSTVEKQLDDYFRFGQEAKLLESTTAPLAQCSSALDLLGLPQVSLAIQSIGQRINGFLAQPSSVNEAAFSSLAVQFSQVTDLLDLFTRAPERAQADYVFDVTSRELKHLRSAPQAIDEHGFDSVESLSFQRRANAHALLKKVVAQPDNTGARQALLDSIQGLKDDGALMGDAQLTALSSIDISPLMTPVAMPADSQDRDQSVSSSDVVALEPMNATDKAVAPSLHNDASTLATLDALLSTSPAPAPVYAPLASSEDDLYGIFLEEAHGVLNDAQQLILELEAQPGSLTVLTDLRRSFHTLKGSSRMVGFKAFGDAAWHIEQVVNGALARQAPASIDLIQFIRGGQESLALWLSQLDDTLLNLDLNSSPIGQAPDFTVASNVPGFVSKLAPYLQAYERSLERQAAVSLATPTAIITHSGSEAAPILSGANHHSTDISQATVKPPETARPKISLVANNEGLRPQDFIDKARNAVMAAQAIELSKPAVEPPSLVLNPVQLTTPVAAKVETLLPDNMVSIGPLRLPKPLYLIYLQEVGHHIEGLLQDLKQWHTQAPSPSSYDAYKHAHSLKGSASTIGFGVMKDLASPLESLLQLSVESEIALNSQDLSVFEHSLIALKRIYDQFAIGQYPSAQTIDIDALTALTLDISLRSKSPPPTHPPTTPSSLRSEQHDQLAANALSAAQAADAIALNALEFRVAALAQASSTQASTQDVLDVYDQLPIDAAQAGHEDRVRDEIEADIWPDFVQEADLIMPRAQSCLVALPDDSKAINDLRRDLHTLKGSSRMAGAMRMGAMLHELESKLEKSLQAQAPFILPDAHDALLDEYDAICGVYEVLKDPSKAMVKPLVNNTQYLGLMASASALFDDALSAKPALASLAPKVLADFGTESAAVVPPMAAEAAFKLATLIPLQTVSNKPTSALPATEASVAHSNETALALPAMRMRTDVLDHLVNQASEMSSSKGRMDQHVLQLRASLRELTDNVERLRKQLREIEIQAESQMATRTELASSANTQFDPLEFDRFTRFQELTRMLTESLNDMLAVRDSVAKTLMDTERELLIQNKTSKDLTQSLMRSRLVAFDAVSDRLYRVVRQTAREAGKLVALDIQGGHLTLDRSILERITGGLEHLVRNSVVHGIETARIRALRGKPAQGTVTIQIKQQGNELEIILGDDGGGLPLERIRDTAIAKGLLSNQSLPTVQQLTELIFVPGFSTAETVTELAGRGIGMDVVRSDIVGLGGRITLTTTPQQSTRFNIRIPLTLAINQVLMVMAQEVQYAIPTSLIQSVVSVKPSDLAQAYSQQQINQRALNYPFAHLSQLLGLPVSSAAQSRAASVILLSNGSDTVAVHVDQVMGNQESVVKPLSTVMLRIPGLSSATLLNDGKLCLILDPVQLWLAQHNTVEASSNVAATALDINQNSQGSAYSLSTQRPVSNTPPNGMVQVIATRAATDAAPAVRQRKLAMVVDDSLTVRKVTQKLLLREGWEVLLAKDGIDALEQLQGVTPAVMLVDIEMPRMDGFDLTRNVRADGKLKAIPIIMITSRIADKHRDHAFSLGVNAYMGKPYHDNELLAEMVKLTAVGA